MVDTVCLMPGGKAVGGITLGRAEGAHEQAPKVRPQEKPNRQHGASVSQVGACRKAEFDPLLFFLHHPIHHSSSPRPAPG
jgi:hypothetical protein